MHWVGAVGKGIDLDVLESLKARVQTLCVAGGVGVDNVESLRQIGAKMLDINSSIESKVGKKDSVKLQKLLAILKKRGEMCV